MKGKLNLGTILLPVAGILVLTGCLGLSETAGRPTQVATGVHAPTEASPVHTPVATEAETFPASPFFSPAASDASATPLTNQAASHGFASPSSTVTYVSSTGRFSIEVPSGYLLLEGRKPSVDGVIAPMPNAVVLQDRPSGQMLVTIIYIEKEERVSLSDFLAEEAPCVAAVPDRQPEVIGGIEAVFVRDTPCGPYGSSVYALVQARIGYLIQVEDRGAFAEVQPALEPILATFMTLE